MKTLIPLFSIVLGFLSVIISPQARATCQEGCGTSNFNTFLGDDALVNNTTGTENTAIGFNALFSNTIGGGNVADGSFSLANSTAGFDNVAVGHSALIANQTGSRNIAIGSGALQSNTTGGGNIAVGTDAGEMITTGSQNIYIGGTVTGLLGESNTIRIGHQNVHRRAFIGGISGTPVSGAPVVVDTGGHLGVVASSARFKTDIKPMDKASEAILALKPVTFRYKHDLDPEGIPQFGLVAEQVEKVNPDLVARDEQGKPYTVRYEAVNAMLLNEFLKEHRKNEQQRKDFEAALARQQKQIDALTTGLQKLRPSLNGAGPHRKQPRAISRTAEVGNRTTRATSASARS